MSDRPGVVSITDGNRMFYTRPDEWQVLLHNRATRETLAVPQVTMADILSLKQQVAELTERLNKLEGETE